MLKHINCYRICTSLLLVCLVCCLAYGDAIGADIFGLKRGMTVSQIRALGFGTLKRHENKEGFYYVENPEMPKDAWTVGFLISPKDGLLKVSFFFRIETNAYGHGVKEKYKELREIMKKKYGKGEEYEGLLPGSMWNEPRYWMLGLMKGERELKWVKLVFDADNKWRLEGVAVQVDGVSLEVAVIEVGYEFQGWDAYQDARKAKEASQF